MSIALSKRQEQFISCVFEGLRPQDIATKYKLNVGTVKNTLSRAYSKLGIHHNQIRRGAALELIAECYKQNAIQLWIGEN